jgi:hypothetical protein
MKKKIIELKDSFGKKIEEMGSIYTFFITIIGAILVGPFVILYYLILMPIYNFFRMLFEVNEFGWKKAYRKNFNSEAYDEEERKKKQEKNKLMEEKFPQGLRKQFKGWNDWPEAYVEDGVAVYGADGRTLLYVDEKVEEFVVPDGVINIYHSCFAHCSQLKKVVLPLSLKRIGKRAFFECVSLQDIVIPDSVSEIGEELFEDCSSLEHISLPDQIIELPDRLFANCRNLRDFVIPENVKTIGTEAFKRCYNIDQIVTNEKLEIIGEKAFEDCYSLKEFIMPDSVKFFQKGMFDGCHSLEHLHFSVQIKDFGGSCCQECWSINRITMTPLTEKEKSYYKEYWEKYADKVDISTSENPIPDSKFWAMGDSLYYGIPRLSTVCLVFCFTKKKEYTIPSFVTNIKQEAFSSCKDLRSLRLSPYVKNSCDPWEHNNVTYSFIYTYWPQIDNVYFDESLKNTYVPVGFRE